MSKPSSIVCFYCCKPGHTSNKCYFKNQGVPEGKYKWIAKNSNVLSNMKRLQLGTYIISLNCFAGFIKSLIINEVLFFWAAQVKKSFNHSMSE